MTKMEVKIGILFIGILVGCFNADPLPKNDFVDNELFYHTNPSARIVGGSPAPEGSVPYMVALSQGVAIRSFVCGGSILTQRTVLTAAHCIAGIFSWGSLVSSLRVTVGTNHWNLGGQILSVERNVTHQHYVSQTIKNDIGILVTSSNIIFSERVVPVVPSYNFVDAGIEARAAGWGRIRLGGPLSQTLLELTVTTIDGERCVSEVAVAAVEHGFLNAPPVEAHIEICSFHSPDHGMCHGDSGSALVRVDNGHQIGVVSWGIQCAVGAPDMFVRVSAYRDWILANLV